MESEKLKSCWVYQCSCCGYLIEGFLMEGLREEIKELAYKECPRCHEEPNWKYKPFSRRNADDHK